MSDKITEGEIRTLLLDSFQECRYHAPHSILTEILEMCFAVGYTTHDRSGVGMDRFGAYDKVEAEKWEAIHQHDIRLPCYVEHGCALLIDPINILELIKAKLGSTMVMGDSGKTV